ncbi:hypothetical protein AHAS_Ahas11G0235100 [Arachis hypogaea]
MHEYAEYGNAAHWLYKETGNPLSSIDSMDEPEIEESYFSKDIEDGNSSDILLSKYRSLKPGHPALTVEGSHLLADDERELLVAVIFGLAASEAVADRRSSFQIKRWEAYAQQIDEKEEARDEDDDGDDDVQWQTNTSIYAARQRIQEQLSAVTADMVMLSKNEPEKKKKTESKGSENGDTKLCNCGQGSESIFKERCCSEGIAVTYCWFGKEATKRKNHLAAAVAGDDEGSQLLLLNAVEEFCYKKGSNALKEVALILKALYDVDLVEEEHVVYWYSKGLKGDKKDSQI